MYLLERLWGVSPWLFGGIQIITHSHVIVNTNPDFYKLFKSCVRWRNPSHTPAFLIIIIHEGGKPVKSETGFFWGEGVFFRCRLDLPLLYPMRGLARLVAG